jgi:hypothetical protein
MERKRIQQIIKALEVGMLLKHITRRDAWYDAFQEVDGF